MAKQPFVQEVDAQTAMGEVDTVKGVRYVKEGPIGHEHLVARPIAATKKEAQEEGKDWYDPYHQTWFRGGFKPEKEIYGNVGIPYVPLE